MLGMERLQRRRRLRRDADDYGIYGYAPGQTRKAHRIAWTHAYGELPPHLLVCHRCDNPPCVNPRRLFLGTHADNIRDKVRKGRANQERENNNHSRVTRKTAAEIRRLKAERVPQRQIAQRFDISESLVSLIVNNKAWVD